TRPVCLASRKSQRRSVGCLLVPDGNDRGAALAAMCRQHRGGQDSCREHRSQEANGLPHVGKSITYYGRRRYATSRSLTASASARSFFRLWFSICRIRSRVTLKVRPTSSSVLGCWPSSP